MEKTIIKYVLHMLTSHSSATLLDRLRTLLDILEAVPTYYYSDIIEAVCKIEGEEETDASDV